MKKLMLFISVGIIEVLLLSPRLFGQTTTIISDWPDSYQTSVPVAFSILSDRHVERVYCNHRSAKTNDTSIITEYGEQEESRWTISLNENETTVRIRAYGKSRVRPLLDTICKIDYNKHGAIISIGTGSDTPESKGGPLPRSAQNAKSVFDQLTTSFDICLVDTILLNKCDANADSIMKAMDYAKKHLPVGNGNIVFVYLSGHGEHQKGDMGFKFQVKSKENCVDSVYIVRDTLTKMFKEIADTGAKVWVFTDACYAKDIFSNWSPEQLKDIQGGILFFTAGLNEQEKAKDGVYADALIKALDQEKRFNTSVDARSLNSAIRKQVKKNNKLVKSDEDELQIIEVWPYGNIKVVEEEKLFFNKVSNGKSSGDCLWSPVVSIGMRGSMRNQYIDPVIRFGVVKQLCKGRCDRVRCFAELQFNGINNKDYRFGSYLGEDTDLRYIPTSMFCGGIGFGMGWNFYHLDVGFNLAGRIGRLRSETSVMASSYSNILVTETVARETTFMDITPSIIFNPLTNISFWKHFEVEIGYSIMFASKDSCAFTVNPQVFWKSLMLNIGYSIPFPSNMSHYENR